MEMPAHLQMQMKNKSFSYWMDDVKCSQWNWEKVMNKMP